MIILAIETSCDDTCLALVKKDRKSHRILANLVSSQVKIHAPFGGVVPSLAKREHQKNLIPLLELVLKKLNPSTPLPNFALSLSKGKTWERSPRNKMLEKILAREEVLLKKLKAFLKKYPPIPEIDLIAVTIGPGLEPALWPGINLAKALAYVWSKPIIGVNHIEGHIYANYFKSLPFWQDRGVSRHALVESQGQPLIFPAICLVVSGGHTQIILIRDFLKYKLLGETRDDAAGEAFDKVAKLLGLGYPGGPIISQRAKKGQPNAFDLPRPMIQSKDFDFSFSGLKTAVLYLRAALEGSPQGLPSRAALDICASFQQAVIDVLIAKTIKAAREYQAKTIMLSGGVAANQELRKQMSQAVKKYFPSSNFQVPASNLCTDNAAMIALAAYYRSLKEKPKPYSKLQAQGNLRIAE